MKKPFDLNAPYQPTSFEFNKTYAAMIPDIISRYPKGKQKSAVMPLLDLAQRQMAEEGAKAKPPYGGWLPRAAMDHVAEILDIPKVKVYEVASFYSMYYTAPIGKHLVQVCTTTPCMLCGSGDIVKACKDHMGIDVGETTPDGLFTLVEVECLGACVNAPMVQVNDDYYEDLTTNSMKEVISTLAQSMKPSIGSQKGRKSSMALSGPTTLKEKAKKLGVY